MNNILNRTDVFGNQVFVSNITIIHPNIQVDLNGDKKVFQIDRYSEDLVNQTISVDRPGKNYGVWYWSVTPTKIGTYFLELVPFEVPSKTPIGGGEIKIEVTVNENVTEAAAKNETTTTTTTKTTAPAENNTITTTNTTKKTTPGFESIFALTGLLAVAYLVLSRRE